MISKKRTFEILNKAKYGDTASRIFDISLTILMHALLSPILKLALSRHVLKKFLSNFIR